MESMLEPCDSDRRVASRATWLPDYQAELDRKEADYAIQKLKNRRKRRRVLRQQYGPQRRVEMLPLNYVYGNEHFYWDLDGNVFPCQ